jgi:hypothetical protein
LFHESVKTKERNWPNYDFYLGGASKTHFVDSNCNNSTSQNGRFQKEELIGIIEKLLGDRTTLVVGSAVMAFEEVCPERIELVHKNYRKLCNLLVDVDEWGQVVFFALEHFRCCDYEKISVARWQHWSWICFKIFL